MGIKIDEMNQTHLGEFVRCANESYRDEKWQHDENIKTWRDTVARKTTCEALASRLRELPVPNENLKRKQVKEICENPDNSALHCLVSVMAWGGQSHANSEKLFENSKTVEFTKSMVKKLRNGSTLHLDAYDEFKRAGSDAPGLGPAYFTKLIFFCGQGHKGYMMDQWVAKSINLLAVDKNGGKEYIRIIKGKRDAVCGRTTKEQYDCVCQTIDTLASHPSLLAEHEWLGEYVELALFGGKGSKWREYVKTEYPRSFPNKKPKGDKND